MKSFSSRLRNRTRGAVELLTRYKLGQVSSLFVFACAVPFLLRLPLRRLQALLGPVRPVPPVPETGAERLRECMNALIAVGHPIVPRGCLCRGITLYYFLRRAGCDVQLCFGVGRLESDLDSQGHCWLERDGRPYLEPVDPEPLFVPTFRMGAKW